MISQSSVIIVPLQYLWQAEAKLAADGEAGDGLAAQQRLGNLGGAAVARRRQQRRHRRRRRRMSRDGVCAGVVVWTLELLLLLAVLVLQEYHVIVGLSRQ